MLFLADFHRSEGKRQREDMEQEMDCLRKEIAVLKEEIIEQND